VNRIVLYILLSISILLSGCSEQEMVQTSKPQVGDATLSSLFSETNLTSIELYIYNKDQPEMMTTLLEDKEIKPLLSWLKKSTRKTDLSMNIKNIYFIRFVYEIGGEFLDGKHLAYVVDENNNNKN